MAGVDVVVSDDRCIMSWEEVDIFLKRVKECLNDDSLWKINNEIWASGRVNKTQMYLAEKNLHDDDIAEIIREIQVCNYCYTAKDRNENFPNETFWFFGITKYVIDQEENLYIKLKIRKFDNDFLLIMSFHPEQPSTQGNELTFPYAN